MFNAAKTKIYNRRDAKIILTFAVPDLDDTISQLKAKGVVIFSSPWQFPDEGVRDPDGNTIKLEQILS
jgi:predicted enzyme related to lactoylglutathione lyase